MHWLKQWREDFKRKDGGRGISKEELAERVRTRHTGCTDALIGIIESGGITHPGIEKRIAEVTGCTAEQYNTMVHKMHHGGYAPTVRKRKYSDFKNTDKMAPIMTPGMIPENATEIVVIDRMANEVARFESATAAARHVGCSSSTITSRCRREERVRKNEFGTIGMTFRRACEWDAMTREQQIADIQTQI